ncbi:MAG: YIP1 family protein [Chloroflexota bacterium]
MGNQSAVTPVKRFHFELLLSFLIHPGKMAGQIIQKQATWLTPLLVVSLMILIRGWFSVSATNVVPIEITPPPNQGPVGLSENQLISSKAGGGIGGGGGGGGGGNGGGEITPAPEGNQSIETQTTSGNQILPALATTASLWIGWFLLGILLFLGMVIGGSPNTFTETLNLVGWSCLPLGIRQIPLLITSLVLPSFSANTAGLSALVDSTNVGVTNEFLISILKMIDIYFIWQVVLILVIMKKISPLSTKRVLAVTLSTMVIFLLLAAMPGFLTVLFGQLTQPVPGTY